MVFRRLDAELTLNTAPYSAALHTATVEIRTFSAEAVAATRAVETGTQQAGEATKAYAATVAETARANVEARTKETAALRALRSEYQAIADAAVKGSAQQVAASKLVEDANKKLIASGVEVQAANSGLIQGATGIVGLFERIGVRAQSSSGLISSAMRGITADASAFGAGVSATVAGVTVGLAAFEAVGVHAFQSTASEVRSFQRIAGTTAEDSSKLVYALHQLGIEPMQASAALGIFSRNLVDHADKVEAAGVAIAHLKNGNVDTIGSLLNLADTFQKTGPGAEGTALAMDLLGRNGKALIPVLQRGRDGLAEFFAEADKHGLVFSQRDLDQAKELTLKTRDLEGALKGLEVQAGRTAVPFLTSLASGLTTVLDEMNRLDLPVAPLLAVGAAGLVAAKGMAALGAATSAVGAEWAGFAVASAAGPVGAAVALSGALLLVANSADKHASALSKVDSTVISWERHIPLVGNALADLDAKVTGTGKATEKHTKMTQDQVLALAEAKAALAEYGSELDSDTESTGNLTEAHKQQIAEVKRHEQALTSSAESIGVSEEGLVRAIGYAGQSNIAMWAAEEEAAKKFAAAVAQGEAAAASSLSKDRNVVGAFSTSSLESAAKASTRAADSATKDDTRVADAIQHVSDLQEQFAEQRATSLQQYADKVAATDQKMIDAQQNYTDTVESENQKVADADQHLADERIDAAQRVDDAERKLADDRISQEQAVADAEARLRGDQIDGQRAIHDARQRLADTQQRQAVQGDPAATRALNDQIALRDANQAVVDAQESARKKQQADEDAVTKAKETQIKTLASDQAAVDKARLEAVKSIDAAQDAADKAHKEQVKAVEKAEDDIAKIKDEQNKLAVEGLTVGDLTLSQQRQMRDAIASVGKAQEAVAQQASTAVASVAEAVSVSVDDIKRFYDSTLADGTRFSEGIKTAIAQGYDPGFIARLLEEGPQQAAPILERILAQNDTNLRDIINSGEQGLRKQALALADITHNVEIAANTSNATIRDDFDNAMKALPILAANGGHMAADALAKALGVGVADVARIAGEYGGALAAGINPVLAGVGAKTIDYGNDPTYNASLGAGRNYFAATGGQVPGGYGTRDDVPAMLTRGEIVFSVPAVQRAGAQNLLDLHDQLRRGYAAGGYVTAADVDLPPDLSMYGSAVGYSGDKVDRKGYDEVVAYLNGKASTSGGASASGGPPGDRPTGQVADWVAAGIALAGKPTTWVTPEVNIAMFESGGDPNAINNWDSNAAAGTPSKGLMQVIDPTFRANMVPGHGDIWNPVDNVAAATNYIAGRYGDPWNTPGERSLARGGAYQGYEAGGLVRFASYDEGGWLHPGLTLAYNGLTHSEPVGGGFEFDYRQFAEALRSLNLVVEMDKREVAIIVQREAAAIATGRSRV